jgi:hypothetical protein
MSLPEARLLFKPLNENGNGSSNDQENILCVICMGQLVPNFEETGILGLEKHISKDEGCQ